MAPSPTQTKAWWRPKGWFTEHEEKIMVNRILRDDPSKGDMHNRQAITPKLLWKSLCDFDLWPIYAIGLTFGIPPNPSDQYLTLTLRGLGFDTFDSNLLSIPAQITTTINVCFLTFSPLSHNQVGGEIGLTTADAYPDLHLDQNQSARVPRPLCAVLVPPLPYCARRLACEYTPLGVIRSCHRYSLVSLSYVHALTFPFFSPSRRIRFV
jgi:hypothetical protein